VATYNGERFLNAQLQSIAHQTRVPDVVLIADDGSIDETNEISRAFAEQSNIKVELVRNTRRLGYGENFLTAAAQLKTDYIAFCDQDDLWRPDKLEVAVGELQRTGDGLFVHAATLIDDEDRYLGRFSQGIRRSTVINPTKSLPWGVFYGFSMVVRREVLTVLPWKARGPHTFEVGQLLSHDLWIYFVATSLFKVAVSTELLAAYRQHGGNVTPHLRGAWFKRLTSSLGKAVDGALSREEIASYRAALLLQMEGRLRASSAGSNTTVAISFWQRVARAERERVAVYSSTPLSRVDSWCRMVAAGHYKEVGWRLAVKDLLAGALSIRRRAQTK